MILIKDFPGELWKKLEIDQESTNEINIQISNYGRVKSFSKLADGRLLQGSMQEGYRVLRLKLYSARGKKSQKELDHFREQIALESKKIKETEKELHKAKVPKSIQIS